MESGSGIAVEKTPRAWTTVGPDFSYGTQAWYQFRLSLARLRSEKVFLSSSQTTLASTGTTNGDPEIQKVLKSDPDGVPIRLFSGNLIDFVRQRVAKWRELFAAALTEWALHFNFGMRYIKSGSILL